MSNGAVELPVLPDLRGLADEAVDLVRAWLAEAAEVAPDAAGARLAGVLRDPAGLDFTVGFVDGVVRPEDHRVAAANLRRLAARPPAFLPAHLRGAIRLGGATAPLAPGIVVPIARRALRGMVGHLILDASEARLGRALRHVARDGVRLNLNLLGEAVLGEREAARRLEGTAALLRRDDVDYVSIKVSATTAPHQPWGFEATVAEVIERLEPLYRIAARSPSPKFINLDMEEYRDLEMTMAVFTRLLEKPEFAGLEAGIVLQTYLPDALGAMQRLQEWAARRVAAGGAPIKVRVVKGANLPMEQVQAELHGWPLATWSVKQHSDTHYKRVLDWACTPERVANVRLGVAGHNLFDIAFAWLLAQRRGAAAGIEFEMLLGMAQQQAEVVRRHVGGLLLYTPIVHPDEFDVAIAYLIRRLEEGASQENFMSAVFELADSSALFERERQRFLASVEALGDPVPAANRVQDRTAAPEPAPARGFENRPDSDPAIAANQAWAEGIRTRAAASELGLATRDANVVADRDELEQRIRTALDARPRWGELSGDERAEVLHRAGELLEARRGELMEIAAAECGKTLDQSDPEVSEAIDFAHYYAELARGLDRVDGAAYTPARCIVVTPPWNFPVAIPAGSTIAALASGASVLLKPASAAARCGALVAEALWDAGVPRDALQYVRFADRELGTELVRHEAVDRVILTGGYETAERFRAERPGLELLAETSGKNAIIITPNADYDLAVNDVVASAFGHAGQKCSASSLVVLVGQAARSKRLRNQLLDGVRSLQVGPPTDPLAKMGPLTSPAEGKLLRGLTTLGPGERWVIAPRRLDEEGRLWSPGVRAGVRRGSEYHLTEYFGPILGVMTAETLDEAIDIVNDVDYGLTSGLHSLDRDEIARWLDRVHAGNLYVNRGITGAIVQRQPFGGWKKSVVGATTKAGGPNYLVGLGEWASAPAAEGAEPAEPHVRALVAAAGSAALERAARSDELAWQEEFGRCRDVQGMRAERNVFRYLPVAEPVTVRAAEGADVADAVRVAAAGLRAGARFEVSVAAPLPELVARALRAAGVRVDVEDDERFAGRAARLRGRLRFIGSEAQYRAVAEAAGGSCELAIWRRAVTESGRLELLPFLHEQAVSITAHRFGTPNHLTEGLLAE